MNLECQTTYENTPYTCYYDKYKKTKKAILISHGMTVFIVDFTMIMTADFWSLVFLNLYTHPDIHAKFGTFVTRATSGALNTKNTLATKYFNSQLEDELDVNPRRDDDASSMSSHRCMLRPT